jgi:hypothetical protein
VKSNIVCTVLLMGSLCGCGTIMKAFSVDSPRPNKEQVSAAKSITEKNVPVIVSAQTDKQQKIARVASAAIHNLAKATRQEQVVGITNVAANAIDGIQHADGTAKILGGMQEKAVNDILKMSVSEYSVYAMAQGYTAVNNIDKTKAGIKIGWQWTSRNIAAITGIVLGGGGMSTALGLALRKALLRKKLLQIDGSIIEELGSDDMKSELAKAHSTVAVNAKKEHGLL